MRRLLVTVMLASGGAAAASPVEDLVMSPDGRVVVTLQESSRVRWHEENARRALREIAVDGADSLVWMPRSGSVMVTGSGATWYDGDHVLGILAPPPGRSSEVVLLPDGRLVASSHEGNPHSGFQDYLAIHRTNDLSPPTLETVCENEACAAKILMQGCSPRFKYLTGGRLIWRGRPSGLDVVDEKTGKSLLGFGDRDSRDGPFLAVSSDERRAATFRSSPHLEVWSLRSGRREARIPAPDARHAAFSPDGRRVAVAFEHAVEVWDLHKPRHRAQLALPPGATAARIGWAGTVIAVGTGEGDVVRLSAP